MSGDGQTERCFWELNVPHIKKTKSVSRKGLSLPIRPAKMGPQPIKVKFLCTALVNLCSQSHWLTSELKNQRFYRSIYQGYLCSKTLQKGGVSQ